MDMINMWGCFWIYYLASTLFLVLHLTIDDLFNMYRDSFVPSYFKKWAYVLYSPTYDPLNHPRIIPGLQPEIPPTPTLDPFLFSEELDDERLEEAINKRKKGYLYYGFKICKWFAYGSLMVFFGLPFFIEED